MKIFKIVIIFAMIFLFPSFAFAQTTSKTKPAPVVSNFVKSSPAYAEVLLRKTELEANLEDLLVSYTDDFPKIKETRYELDLIGAALDKILAVNASESSRLTLALGKLLVRKAQLETDLWSLKNKYGDDHVDVKRASRKVAVFEKAVNEILP
ncbi:MAG: hypothetical protein ACR2N3_12775 [Pyrinomonadaceae bacterium]